MFRSVWQSRPLKRLRMAVCLLAIVIPITVQVAYTCSPPGKFAGVDYTFLSYAKLRAPISATSPQLMGQTDNFLLYKQYVLVVEQKRGVHIWSLENLNAPEPVSFIPIYGVDHINVKDDTLLASSYTDLVVIDISEPEMASEVNRLEFYYREPRPSSYSDDGSSPYLLVGDAHSERGIVVETEYRYASSNACGSSPGCSCSTGQASVAPSNPSTNPPPTAVNASLSASVLKGDYLYTVATDTDRVMSIYVAGVADPLNPYAIRKSRGPLNAETLYIDEQRLFIGSTVGVSIYNLFNPEHPSLTGSFAHAWQCDPVVADGDFGYATLRRGAGCGGLANELDVLDLSDITTPQLVSQLPLNNPHGLALEGNLLFIADGYAGLKVVDVSEPAQPQIIHTLPGFNALDVLLAEGWGLIMSSNQVLVFDRSNLEELNIIATID